MVEWEGIRVVDGLVSSMCWVDSDETGCSLRACVPASLRASMRACA